MKREASSLAAAFLGLLGPVFGAEFLPFPPSQQQSISPTASYEKQFSAAIAKMDCGQLGQLRNDLVKRLNAAPSDADRSYYARLIGSVTSQILLVPGCLKG